MLSVSHILCGHEAGNEQLRYGRHRKRSVGPASQTPRPVVVLALTHACNLRCVHCYASAQPEAREGELTTQQWMDVIDDLAQFNVPAVLFSGGEPLVHPDFLTLVEYAVSLGLRPTLSTNGTLIDDTWADTLASIGLTYVGISLDGMQKCHDKLRGVEGSFQQSLDAIDRCHARGLRTGVRFTLHALNANELDDLIDLCASHQVDRLCIYHLAYSGRGAGMQKIAMSAEQTRERVERIFERTRMLHKAGVPMEVLTVGNHADQALAWMHVTQENPTQSEQVFDQLSTNGGNGSGNYIASIDPFGGVHYDQFSWHYSCGNVLQQPLSTIWSDLQDDRLRVLRDRRAYLPDTCQSCRFVPMCNGNLRTRAEAATGDWLGMDPACYLSEHERAALPVLACGA